MKKIILLLLFVPFIGFSQSCDSIKMTKFDYTEVVVSLTDKKANDIYKKMKAWINRTYKNPDMVIKADEPDNYIRISGLDNYSFKYMGNNTYSLNYDLELSIKEGKYKVKFINVKSNELSKPKLPDAFFDEKGNIKGIKSLNLKMQNAVLVSLNSIHFNLYNFITKTENDW